MRHYGPLDTRFDLLNEGAPGDSWVTKTQLEGYIAHMYSNYVDAFGNADVTVSSIVSEGEQTTLSNLIDMRLNDPRRRACHLRFHAAALASASVRNSHSKS